MIPCTGFMFRANRYPGISAFESVRLSSSEPIYSFGYVFKCPLGAELHFYLYVDTGREVQVHHGVDRFGCRIDDVNQAFVDTHLVLLTGIFVHEGRLIHGVFLFFRWQRDGTFSGRARALSRFQNRARGLINNLMIVGTNADTDPLDFFVV